MLEKKGKLRKFLQYPQDCTFLKQILIRSYQYLNLTQSLLALLEMVYVLQLDNLSMLIPYEIASSRFSHDNRIKSLIVNFVRDTLSGLRKFFPESEYVIQPSRLKMFSFLTVEVIGKGNTKQENLEMTAGNLNYNFGEKS